MRNWLGVSVLVLVLDQASKIAVMQNIVLHQVTPLIPSLNLFYAHNTGASFSLLSDAGGWQRWLFSALALIVSGGLSVWLLRLQKHETLLAAALSLVLGGAIGNLIDRVAYGYVIDFVDVFWPGADLPHFPAFNIADVAITYRHPIVDVYLKGGPAAEPKGAQLAPPWSTVPWHVLALMEAAVERGIGAFSQSEAARRRVPWLDLVRDPEQRAKLAPLASEFARAGYRPAALENLVTPQAATARWRALEKFVASRGHLLVTNGGYRLASWSPEAFVFEVVNSPAGSPRW